MLTFKAAKANFFDRKKVMDAVDKGRREVLTKLGAYTKTTAQRSIKQARRLKPSEMSPEMAASFQGVPASQRPFKSSDPGQPPRSRTKKLRKGILYAFDPETKSVVAGPVKFSNTDAPVILEAGGTSTVPAFERPSKRKGRKPTEAQLKGLAKARAAGKFKRSGKKPKAARRRVKIAARPYMTPALAVVKPKIPDKFKNMIHK